MKIYYSSMYIEEKIEKIDDLFSRYKPQEISLYVDTNICIFIRDFIRQPQIIIGSGDKTLWPELKQFFKNVKQFVLNIDYAYGMDEAMRSKNNFGVNDGKLRELLMTISLFSQMDYFQLLEHSKLVTNKLPCKDETSISQTKIDGLKQESEFQIMLHLTYAGLLKLYLLDKTRKGTSNIELMKRYIDFMTDEIDVVSVSSLAFAYHYIDGGRLNKLIHSSKDNTFENLIHDLWNAAIDLSLLSLVSVNVRASKEKSIPVFVTSDEKLWLFFNTQKVKVSFTAHGKVAYPPIIALDLSQTNWKYNEIEILQDYYKSKKRINKVNDNVDSFRLIDKMRNINYNLEAEIRRSI